MFQIIGAMAEFERALIQERVRAGLRNARAKGKRLGRPRVIVDASKIASLRSQGRSWAEIVAELGIGKDTAQRAIAGLPKSRAEVLGFDWALARLVSLMKRFHQSGNRLNILQPLWN
jgi:DNA invertase Pin-like site-specific DNA recombinase